jgi:hypothetical protein
MPMTPLGGPRVIQSKRDILKEFVGNPVGSTVGCHGEVLQNQDLLSFFGIHAEFFFVVSYHILRFIDFGSLL